VSHLTTELPSEAPFPQSASRPLDLIEGIVPPHADRCERWPESFRLKGRGLSGEVRFIRGRCKSTNLCSYCARKSAIETVEMLYLDACENSAPSWLIVLTAREFLERADCRRHLEHLRRLLRRRWPEVEWAVLVEFQARGALHLNLLVKGIPPVAEKPLHGLVAGFWCSRVDAEPVGQYVAVARDGRAAIRYTAAHFLKPQQAPPKSWRGRHRFSCTRGYLSRPAAEMREKARASLRRRALEDRLQRDYGFEGAELVSIAQLETEWAAETEWELVKVQPVVDRDGNFTGSSFPRGGFYGSNR